MSDHVMYYVETGKDTVLEASTDFIDAAALRWFALCTALGLAVDADPSALARELREWRAGMLEDVRELEF